MSSAKIFWTDESADQNQDFPIFTSTGPHSRDRWLVDKREEFSVFPAGIIPEINTLTPIILSVGDDRYGERHITQKHFHWVRKATGEKRVTAETVVRLVYEKLGHSGAVHCTEKHSKFKINLTIRPSALMVLELIEPKIGPVFLSVTTLYAKNDKVDGKKIGHYPGRKAAYNQSH